MVAGYRIPTLIGTLPYCFSSFFSSLYQTAAYAIGKHVPSGNLFPTVRSRRPTEQRVYLSTKRVHLPIDQSNNTLQTTTVRLYRTLATYCYLNSQ